MVELGSSGVAHRGKSTIRQCVDRSSEKCSKREE